MVQGQPVVGWRPIDVAEIWPTQNGEGPCKNIDNRYGYTIYAYIHKVLTDHV